MGPKIPLEINPRNPAGPMSHLHVRVNDRVESHVSARSNELLILVSPSGSMSLSSRLRSFLGSVLLL